MKLPRLTAAAAVAAFGLTTACTTTPEPKKEPVVVKPVEPPKPKEKSAQEHFAEAVAAFDAKKYDDAQASFAKVLEKSPGNVTALYNLGVVAERKGDFQKAQEHYEAAHKADPKHEPTLLNLGKTYRLQAKFDQAIALYEEALKDPAREYDVELLNNLAVSYRLAKQYDKAEGALRKLLSRTKDNPEAYKNLTLVYLDQGNFRLAEFISGTARKLDEKDPGVYNNLGIIYLKQDQKPMALAQFQKAVELKEDFAPGHINIGAMALSYRDYENAEQSLRKALELNPSSPEAKLYLAWALEGQKGRDPKKGLAAGEQFETVLKIRPDHEEATCGAGWAYSVDKAGWEKAIGFLEKCKTFSRTTDTDKQLIDAKVKGLTAMLKSGQAQQAAPEPEKREAPKAAPGGPSVLDKAVEAAAQDEAAVPAEGAETPAEGTPAPEGQAPEGQAPQGAPPAGGAQ